jgi:hypothetical protein
MATSTQTRIPAILEKYQNDLVSEWIKELKTAGSTKEARISESDLFSQAKEFISLLQKAAQGDVRKTTGAEWAAITAFLENVSGRMGGYHGVFGKHLAIPGLAGLHIGRNGHVHFLLQKAPFRTLAG